MAMSLVLLTLTMQPNPSSGKRRHSALRFLVILGLFTLIVLTGHLGGQLTHGPRFLSTFAPKPLQAFLGPPVEEAAQTTPEPKPEPEPAGTVYERVIQPIMDNHCSACHGPERQTAKLAVHTPDTLMAGGWSGPVIVPGNAQDSELLKRVLLPLEDPGHMPPEGKTQLSQKQIDALQWWIENGAPFDATLSTDELPPELKELLPPADGPEEVPGDIPLPTTLDEELLRRLIDEQISIQWIQQNEQRLWVSFPAIADQVTDNTIQELFPLASFIAWLDLSDTRITSKAIAWIAKMPALTELNLRQTAIEPQALKSLRQHPSLERLNLSLIPLDDKIVDTLLQIPNLKRVYLGGTQLSPAAIKRLSAPRIEVIAESTPSDIIPPEPNKPTEQ